MLRPRGYWRHKYLEKQESQRVEDTAVQEHEGTAENTFKPTPSSRKLLLPDGSQAIAASDRKEAHPFSRCDTKTRRLHLGSALDTLRPPPAPGLFERDWLRSLLCEGCGLPATTNAAKCLHCNVVVHEWCRGLPPPKNLLDEAAPPAGENNASSAARQVTSDVSQKTPKDGIRDTQWVCWECQEDMLQALQFYRGRKNQQRGVHLKTQVAYRIVRFVAWIANSNRAMKEEKRAILIQSFIRMRLMYVRYRRWAMAQKRAIIVAVRSASGLPTEDATTRKCNPYVIITAIEPSSEGGIQTFSQQLPTKKGVDRIQPSASAQPSTTPGHTHHAPPHAPVQTMARSVTSKPAGAAASTSSSVGGRSPADGNLRSTSPSFDGSHKALHASSAIGGVDSVGASQIYHWEDEYLLPGVSDSASIAFTVLHQAPMKTVCLGQALILPKQFSRIGEHTVRVSLGKQQIVVGSSAKYRKEQAKVEDVAWEEPGKLTLSIRKSSYGDSNCGDVCGPIVEEIRALSIAESLGSRSEAPTSTPPPAAIDGKHADATRSAGGKHARGRAGANGVVRRKGDLTTAWWVCVWLGRLRLYRHAEDLQPVLSLQLEAWSILRDEVESNRITRPDLNLVSTSSKRHLVLRCPGKAQLMRWTDVIQRNQEQIRKRHERAHLHKGPLPNGGGERGPAPLSPKAHIIDRDSHTT